MSTNSLNRREFLYAATLTLFSCLIPGNKVYAESGQAGEKDIQGHVFRDFAPEELWKWSCEAKFYKKLSEKDVVCQTCPNFCVLSPDDRSVCRSKVNKNGKLYSLTYGNPCAIHLDPVEKKPLFHFRPGSETFSLATAGCNFRCLNCQNWQISQSRPSELRNTELFPSKAVQNAQEQGATSIAYTYSEPITFYEYMLDTSRKASAEGLDNLLISNGFINKRPLLKLVQYIDGANIDLKAFSEAIYKKLNGGNLDPVLKSLKILAQEGVHLELTNLVVPGYTDDRDMLKKMCNWILESLGPDYPLHFLRSFPRYKLNQLSPTPVFVLKDFRKIAMQEGIRYVYIGNTPYQEGLNTYCHNCGKLLIERKGYLLGTYNLISGKCKYCNTKIPGVW